MEKRRRIKVWVSKKLFNNSGEHDHGIILYSNNMYTFPVHREHMGFKSKKLKTKRTDTFGD